MVDARLHHRYAAWLRRRETGRDQRRHVGVRTRPPADGRRCHRCVGTSAARRARRPLVATRTRGQRPCGLVVRPCGAGSTRLGLLARLECAGARCAAAATTTTLLERGATSPTTATAATPATPQIVTGAEFGAQPGLSKGLQRRSWPGHARARPAGPKWGVGPPRRAGVGFGAKPRLSTKYRLPSES